MMTRRILQLGILCLIVGGLQAANRSKLGVELGLVGAIDDNPRVNGIFLLPTDDNYTYTYGLFPQLLFESRGPSSQLNLSYSFGWDRVESDLDLDSKSHAAALQWSSLLSSKVSMDVFERFRKSPDFTSFNVLRGIVLSPEGPFFDTALTALRRDSYENQAGVRLAYTLSPKSDLTFSAAHYTRQFEDDPAFSERMIDQTKLSGGAGFVRRLSDRTTWNVDYSATRFNFEEAFTDVLNHDITLGVKHQFRPTVLLRAGAGPSLAQPLGSETESDSYTGYNAFFNVAKQFEKDHLELSYQHRNATSIGLGSLSRSHRLSLDFAHKFGRRVLIKSGIGVFDTSRAFDNAFDLRGLLSSLILDFLFGEHFALSAGASYQAQDGLGSQDLTRRRVFISLRLMEPELWRSE